MMIVPGYRSKVFGLIGLFAMGAGSILIDAVCARDAWASLTFDLQINRSAVEISRLEQNPAVSPWKPTPLGWAVQAASDPSQPLRERYQNTLKHIDNALEAWQLRRSIVPGFDQSQNLVLQSRGKAIQAYLDADYREAVRLLQQAIDEIDSVQQLEEEYFELNLSLAMSAYEAEDVGPAQEAIALAAALRPEHDEVHLWRRRIETLPDLVAARQEAVDARHAGRLQDEIDALYRVVSLMPKDGVALNRIEVAKQQLRNRKFNQIITQGHQALTEGNLTKARQALTSAQKIYPQYSEIKRLDQSIAQVARDNEISRLIAAAEQDAYQDDWYSVAQKLDAVMKLAPGHNEVIEDLEIARKLVITQRNLDDFVARPHRLSSANIAAAARQEIEQAQALREYSPHMSSTIEKLELELDRWQQPMPVRVFSDGETHIEVRGVGIIGTTVDRIVMLKPGTYQFEGKKKGYRNKLVEVSVSTNTDETATIEIICDEPT